MAKLKSTRSLHFVSPAWRRFADADGDRLRLGRRVVVRRRLLLLVLLLLLVDLLQLSVVRTAELCLTLGHLRQDLGATLQRSPLPGIRFLRFLSSGSGFARIKSKFETRLPAL